ncbi:MAG: hypothetical protein M1616_05765 [Candidatus Thermoplasmatota archaeon]|jgi:hypothetical protein|nr:hypothetical protein [Candidatus Thermoplasmatota archaeon]
MTDHMPRFLGKYTYRENKGWKLVRDIWLEIASIDDLERVKDIARRDGSELQFFMRRNPRVLKKRQDGNRTWVEEVLDEVSEGYIISEISSGNSSVER